LRREVPAQNSAAQVASLDKFHDEVIVTAVLTVLLQYLHYRLVLELSHDSCATKEAFAPRGLTREVRVQDLDRYQAMPFNLPRERAPDRREASSPNLVEQEVPSVTKRVACAQLTTFTDLPPQVQDLPAHSGGIRSIADKLGFTPTGILQPIT